MENLGIKNCWFTLNRDCNLRCKWCYAEGTNYSNKDFINMNEVPQVLSIVKNLGLKTITFMGGEPTCYPYLFEVMELCKSFDLRPAIVTNGIKLADEKFLKKIQQAGIAKISLSLKGYDSNHYEEVTGVDRFETALKAIHDISEAGIPLSVSMVLSADNILKFTDGLIAAKKSGAEHFSLSFCYDFSVLNNRCKTGTYDINKNLFFIIDNFMRKYDELVDITENQFTLAQSFPLCAWPSDFIEKMVNSHQLSSVCQLLKRSGLIFNTDFSNIPCHAMYTVPYGKYGKDYNDLIEFREFWNSPKLEMFYNKLRSLPSKKCTTCQMVKVCGGGCLSNWFNYTFEDFENAKKAYYK